MNDFVKQIVIGFAFGLGIAVASAVLRAIFHVGIC